MSRTLLILLFCAVILLSFGTTDVAAFGAGNIPSFAYLEGKAYRHGDIEDILEKLMKTAGGGFFLSKGTKFTGLDVKRTYFGNWLRDYSQAVDVGALKKVPLQTILNICMALGFLAHGYATGEFEVTKDRLGCYLPTEHIDNPRGYADGEDARKYDPRLRGPIDPRELEVDPRTGMKNYIANEDGSWDTSKGLVRRVLEACIHFGRQYKQSGDSADEYEAFRLLGQAMHTLEDFPAHSNWCELTLQQMGHRDVFAHVGRNVRVHAPNGQMVPLLVTGTFGGADFIHSLMGEATDHLSEASVSDLSKAVNGARSDPAANSSVLRQLLFDMPGGGGNDLSREMDNVTSMRAGQPGGQDPMNMSPQELHDTLWKVLAFRDSVMKKISNTIDKIPGLGALVEKLTNSINVFVFTTLEPFMKPILAQATSALGEGSAQVVNSHDQYEVFNDPNASDPTHSFLSKDHFGLMLNEPAGQVAQVIVEHAVLLIVKAWDDPSIPTRQVTEDILQCLHHPAWMDNRSAIQRKMQERLRQWLDAQGSKQHEVISRLTEQAVKNHNNKRLGDTSSSTDHSHGSLPDGGLQGVLAQQNIHVPGAQVLNAGQDLLSGKMPWQQGFGSGGQHAWREMESNDSSSAPLAPPIGGRYDSSSLPSHGQASSYYQGDASERPHGQQHGHGGRGHHQRPEHEGRLGGGYGGGHLGGGYDAPPPQEYGQPAYGGGGYGQAPQQPAYGGGYDQHQQYGGGPLPQGQWGAPSPGPSPQQGGYYGGPPRPNQYGGYQQGPPGGYQGGGFQGGGY